MAFAAESTYFDTGDGTVQGCFREVDTDNYFEYSENIDGVYEEYPHKVWVTTPNIGIDHGFRYARVMKTRVKVLVDEDSEETWYFKQGSQRRFPGAKMSKEKVWDVLTDTGVK